MNAFLHPIVKQSANIPQQRLDNGYVESTQLDGQMRFGDLRIGVQNALFQDKDGYSVELMVGNSSHKGGWSDALKVGETKSSAELGVSVTLTALIDFDGVQGVKVMVEPYQKGPVVERKADMSQNQAALDMVKSACLGETIDFGRMRINVPWSLNKSGNAEPTVSIDVYDTKTNLSDAMTLELGQAKKSDRIGWVFTLSAFIKIKGRQGITLQAVPGRQAIFRQQADIPREKLDRGQVFTMKMGNDIDLGYADLHVYPNFLNYDTRTIGLILCSNPKIGSTYDHNIGLKIGETKTSEKYKCSVTLVALTEVDGEQGVTLLVTPVK